VFSDGTEISKPISESEKVSDAQPVVGRLSSTTSAGEPRDRANRRPSGSGKAADEDGWRETEGQRSKDVAGGTVP
jgi:hypothetical protein